MASIGKRGAHRKSPTLGGDRKTESLERLGVGAIDTYTPSWKDETKYSTTRNMHSVIEPAFDISTGSRLLAKSLEKLVQSTR